MMMNDWTVIHRMIYTSQEAKQLENAQFPGVHVAPRRALSPLGPPFSQLIILDSVNLNVERALAC